MDDWSQVNVTVHCKDRPETIYSEVSEYKPAKIVVERMQGHFRSVEAAQEAQATRDPKWTAFEADIRDMEQRHAIIGIDHAEMQSVDFSALEIEHEIER